MNLKALDSFYTDETKMIEDGQVFSVDSDELAKDLIKRGVARQAEVGEESGKVKAHQAAPKNKDAGPAPSNRGKGKSSSTPEEIAAAVEAEKTV